MLRSGFRWLAVVAVCFVLVGCGGGSIQEGIPKDPTAPVNPTPDMDRDAPGAVPKKA